MTRSTLVPLVRCLRVACVTCFLAPAPGWARSTEPHTDCSASTEGKDCIYGRVDTRSGASSSAPQDPHPNNPHPASGGKGSR